ncbi:hypothetical protein VTK73DRAFT_8309 [Phialemonium thermophilum]|uniref:ATP-dependent DNA helicase II subunit 1 n=1 Tax=Phialemonium thermophilum TaxID=223376 RepID=A0ABR3Y6U5_9PEZI
MAWGGDEDRRDGVPEAEEEDEIDETDYRTQKDAVLFAIDVSDSMARPPPAGDGKKAEDSALSAALKSAYQLMQQRIISQPKDMMGVLLFGTRRSRFRDDAGGRNAYPHCYLLIDLDVPAAEDVKKLKSLVEEGEDPDNALEPSPEPVAMSNVLFCANQIFTTNAPNFGSRRLFIITDKDDPHPGDKQARSAAAVRAKDLHDLGVTIELFPISHDDRKFDLSKFYDDVVYRDPDADPGSAEEIKTSKSGDGLSLLHSLISNINSKQTAKRAYFSNLPFDIAPGLRISIKGYHVLHRQVPARTCYVWLGGEVAQLAVGETTKLDSDARTVEKAEVKKAYKFGGEFVYFDPEELKSLKSFGETGLRIIGFKPRSLLPGWASVKKSTFIFPSEEGYVGSTRVFSALWQKLLRDKKMGIAWFISRSNANPILVAVMPSRNPDDEESGTPFLPAGLWLYPLPFADDIRNADLRPTKRCSDSVIDQMRVIVQNLQLPKAMYNPTKYPNPSLQWHYRILQTLALEEEVPEQPEDATIPRYKAINKRVGGYIVDWDREVAAEAKKLLESRAIKREAEDEDDEEPRPSKKAKPAKPTATSKKSPGSMNDAELRAAVDQDSLKKLTVVELKDVLASRGLSISGKKADLVERLEQWVEEHT